MPFAATARLLWRSAGLYLCSTKHSTQTNLTLHAWRLSSKVVNASHFLGNVAESDSTLAELPFAYDVVLRWAQLADLCALQPVAGAAALEDGRVAWQTVQTFSPPHWPHDGPSSVTWLRQFLQVCLPGMVPAGMGCAPTSSLCCQGKIC